jgi:adenylate cyclase
MQKTKHGEQTPESLAIRRQNRRYASLAALLAWGIAMALSFLPPWQGVEEKVFDHLSVATSPGKPQLPITIVGIDEASFTQLGVRWPWPRDMHANLTRRLAEAGAAVIAFDVMFPEPSAADADQLFARTISDAGNVVLAADHAYQETAAVRQWMRMDPLQDFTLAGAATGLATLQLSGDAVARRFAQEDDAFWRVTIDTLLRVRPGIAPKPYVPPEAMIRFLGPARTFPYVSYYQVLNGDPSIPKDFFNDQIVLIGREVRASPESGSAQADTFATPFLAASRLLTPGVEIHATMIENAMMGQSIVPATRLQNVAALTCFLLLGWLALMFWQPLRSGALILGLAALAVGASLWAFKAHNLWFATAAPVAGLLAALVSMSAMSFFTERRRAQEIRGAFAMYVSGAVVDEMIAHPERLRLGGERRELTLLFSDLAGFTSMSERLTPDAVANVMNLYLNAMTRIVMAQGGTVDKFIGDAVMAFWGAPLEDPEHGVHAVRAALAMQAALASLQPRLDEMGAGKLAMRIGLHSGPAIVGNMGSDLRFDYTALGDTVNLAARLEGVNKAYGTTILLSAETAKRLAGSIGLRRVDRVRVKGKALPMDIFTPSSNADLSALTEEAWQAYEARDWNRAEEAWSKVRDIAPDDSLLRTFLERIAEYRTEPPPADWDGSIALEKL